MSEENKPKKESFLSKIPFFKKLKSIKNIEIVIAVLIISVMFLIYFGTSNKENASSNKSSSAITNIQYTSASQYAKELEAKLEKTLSQIQGAGAVSVVITLESSSELIIAKTIETTKKSESVTDKGVTTKTENVEIVEKPLIVSGKNGDEPIILLEVMPKISGVVVVAQGATDVNVKLNILKALQALLTIPSGNIEILA